MRFGIYGVTKICCLSMVFFCRDLEPKGQDLFEGNSLETKKRNVKDTKRYMYT